MQVNTGEMEVNPMRLVKVNYKFLKDVRKLIVHVFDNSVDSFSFSLNRWWLRS